MNAKGDDVSILIQNCTIITMNPQRTIVHDGAVGIDESQIVYAGPASACRIRGAATVVDGKGGVLLPGLIDSHAHAGHGLTKTLGEGGAGISEGWDAFMERIYFQGSTPDFWRAEALLSGLEKLRFGVTTGMSMLGSYPRYDDEECWEAHVEGMAQVGIRDILGVGTPNPPFPKTFRRWKDQSSYTEYQLSHADSFEKTEQAVRRFNGSHQGTVLCYPTPSGVGFRKGLSVEQHVAQNRAMKDISESYGVPIHSHSYGGDIVFARQHFPFVLGPRLSLAHCTGITDEEVRILADTGASVCSGPSTGAYILARCPVVELLEAGCNVAFCTDASAPDRTYDLFEKARFGVRLQRLHFHDTGVLPAGKALEMVTIDAARALGLEGSLGSIEVGKKADLVLVDMKKPHLYPPWHEPLRMVYEASGHDVDTVIVNGRVLMRERNVAHLDEAAILEAAEREARLALQRLGFEEATRLPERLWGVTHY